MIHAEIARMRDAMIGNMVHGKTSFGLSRNIIQKQSNFPATPVIDDNDFKIAVRLILDTTETPLQIVYRRVVHSRNQADHSASTFSPIIVMICS